jgi:hypothetical protein
MRPTDISGFVMEDAVDLHCIRLIRIPQAERALVDDAPLARDHHHRARQLLVRDLLIEGARDLRQTLCRHADVFGTAVAERDRRLCDQCAGRPRQCERTGNGKGRKPPLCEFHGFPPVIL